MKRTEISSHENGKRMGETVASRLARALGVTVEELLGPDSAGDAWSAKSDRHLDDLLAALGERTQGTDAVVAEVLQLLTRRLRLAERRLARVAQ